MSNLLFQVESIIRNNLFKFKGCLLKVYFKAHGCKVGKKLRCHSFPRFRVPPNKNIFIGDYVTIGYDITFEILYSGTLFIGDFVKLTQNIIISSGKEIRIGDYSLFGENVSIRDGDHNASLSNPIALQSSIFMPILIGKDVWIGAGCIILKGSYIPDGVIIGANSIIIKNLQLETNAIYAGNPLRFRKPRT